MFPGLDVNRRSRQAHTSEQKLWSIGFLIDSFLFPYLCDKHCFDQFLDLDAERFVRDIKGIKLVQGQLTAKKLEVKKCGGLVALWISYCLVYSSALLPILTNFCPEYKITDISQHGAKQVVVTTVVTHNLNRHIRHNMFFYFRRHRSLQARRSLLNRLVIFSLVLSSGF